MNVLYSDINYIQYRDPQSKYKSSRHFVETQNIARFVTETEDHNPVFPSLFNQFIVKSLKEWRPFIKFPLSPYRKSVIDFLFLTKGTGTRSPGMESYHLTANTICFHPRYQIMTYENLSFHYNTCS